MTTTHKDNHVKLCNVCSDPLRGRQTLYCSRKCHNKTSNFKFQNYKSQQKRGLNRKIEIIKKLGGCCTVCGYSKNIAALTFHHLDPTLKDFVLTIRECSNNSVETLENELKKCSLLCHNCHMELHYPHYTNLL